MGYRLNRKNNGLKRSGPKFKSALVTVRMFPEATAKMQTEVGGHSLATIYDARNWNKRYPGKKPELNISDNPQPVLKSKAKALVTKRQQTYGHPLDNFHNIVQGKQVLAKCKDPEIRHALEMIWLKMCRLIETPDHEDTINDIAGYAETIHMIYEERKRRNG